MRYEFFEVLVRIARFKYISTGQLDETQHARALHRLFNEHLLPILSMKKLPQWQPFRDKHLWNTEVNDLIKVNEESVEIVLNHILKIPKLTIPRKFTNIKYSSLHMISID